jgi:hypothetical protein
MSKEKFNPADADFISKPVEGPKVYPPTGYTSADMRAAFMRGAAFSRAHIYNPVEMRPAKDAEEALANWPD